MTNAGFPEWRFYDFEGFPSGVGCGSGLGGLAGGLFILIRGGGIVGSPGRPCPIVIIAEPLYLRIVLSRKVPGSVIFTPL